jgi:hypothetical protein
VNQPLVNSITDILTIAMVISGLILMTLGYQHFRYTLPPRRWLRLTCAMVGLYWAGLYAWVLLVPATTSWIGPVFVRPGLVITLLVMIANIIITDLEP